MLSFKSPIIAEALPDGVNWKLQAPLIIDLGMSGMSEPLVIPVGFITDFGSIPWFIPNWIANPQGKAKRAYCMHDYLYRTQIFTQLVSDALLNEGMIVDGVNWFQRFTVYRGLRLGGWVAWDKYSKTPYVQPDTKTISPEPVPTGADNSGVCGQQKRPYGSSPQNF